MSKQVLTLLPMAQNIVLKAGEDYEGYISVANNANATEDLPYLVTVTPYSVIDEHYTADFISMEDSTMIADWIEIPEPSGKVAPNETKKVKFIVHVPEDAPAGGQYATLLVTIDNDISPSGSESAVTDTLAMASIIYATAEGETVHDGEILTNAIPSFATQTPVVITSSVRNDGNVHDLASYVITITDHFTGRVILPNENDDGHYMETIMPDTTYEAFRELNDLPLVGAVKVTQEITFDGQTSYTENVIFICPVWFMLLVFITIIFFIMVIIMLIKKHRRKTFF